MTLEDQVRDVIGLDVDRLGISERVPESERESTFGETFEDHHLIACGPVSPPAEAQVRWALVFGLAFGLARGQNPGEPDASVTARAAAATRVVAKEWSGPLVDDAKELS